MTGPAPVRVTVWNEGLHERTKPEMAGTYPEGIHGAIAAGLHDGLAASVIRTATLDQPDHGLPPEILDETDVLMWWGHMAHEEVRDAVVTRVVERVLGGMGLIVLHSGHYSKVFRTLMGTTCSLDWRNTGERELVWTIDPEHPIAAGVDQPILIPEQEMYGEPFDIPTPDELVFISSFAGGEVFRSGVTYRRGRGRVFYFSPGDEAYPVYFHPQVRRVLANAVEWARPAFPVGQPPAARERPAGRI
ncbi:MAG: ThuA domain-containing protein [Microbacteriaceae bacterium]